MKYFIDYGDGDTEERRFYNAIKAETFLLTNIGGFNGKDSRIR